MFMTRWKCPNEDCGQVKSVEAYELAIIGTPLCLKCECDEGIEMEPAPEVFCETEKGNSLATNGDNFIAWIDLSSTSETVWRLEISWVPENYPALSVRAVEISNSELNAHLDRLKGSGWTIVKRNTGVS